MRFFSPDGTRIGFVAAGARSRNSLYTVPTPGGLPVRLVDGDVWPSATWSDDGFIYFVDTPGRLLRIPEEGGPVETVADTSSGYAFQWPEALPGTDGLVVGTFEKNGDSHLGLVTVVPSTGAVEPFLDEFDGPQRATMARSPGATSSGARSVKA